MEIPLQYGGWQRRVSSIGSVPVTWGFRKAERVGGLELVHDRLGTRLIAIGPYEIAYDRLGTRPVRFGGHELVYNRMGSRLQQIGPFGIRYGFLGARILAIGPFEVVYRALGVRPRAFRITDPAYQRPELDAGTAALLFFVIQLIRSRQESGGDGGGE